MIVQNALLIQLLGNGQPKQENPEFNIGSQKSPWYVNTDLKINGMHLLVVPNVPIKFRVPMSELYQYELDKYFTHANRLALNFDLAT